MPLPADSWDFVAMGRNAKPKDEPQPDLVENIARAMRNPPLMRRLASVEAEFAGEPQGAAQGAARSSVKPGVKSGAKSGVKSGAPPIASPAAPAARAMPAEPAAPGHTLAGVTIASLLEADSELDAIKRRVEEAENGWTMPPRSAEWLGKARRERNRARLRNAAAWLATLFIGGMIITATALMLQP